jgi:hypothetical protein
VSENPFRINGLVDGEYHAGREQEIARFTTTLREPASKLLVSGHRRMGKSSTLARAVRLVNEQGGYAIMADLSTATTVADMANRILRAAAKTLGTRWTDLVSDLPKYLKVAIKVQLDPATQLPLPSLELGARDESLNAQQDSLASVLDTLDTMAARRRATLGVVLDEFQEITRFGGRSTSSRGRATLGRKRGRLSGRQRSDVARDAQPEWHLRGVMQQHQHLAYIMAGSRRSLLDAMIEPDAAFYKMLTPVRFGPIPAPQMATWIDLRLREAGYQVRGCGTHCVDWAGPRTRDIVRVARKCVDYAATSKRVDEETVIAAFSEIVDEESDAYGERWSRFTGHQQNVLRAVAASPDGLTTDHARRAFTLGATGTVSNTLAHFVDDGLLVRSANGSGYAFDDPFFRGWVVTRALVDVGQQFPMTYVATPTSEYD